MSTKTLPRLPRRACYFILLVCLPLLIYLEYGKPVLTADPVLAPLWQMTLTRALGAIVFFALIWSEGYRVLNPLQRPFGRALLFCLPAFLVVINNLPIVALLTGDAYMVHHAPVYWVAFALRCLAIGLFEEAAFRGVILLMFARRRHTTRRSLLVAILLSSAVFGLIHLVNLFVGASPGDVFRQIGYSFLIGAMCAVVLFETRNLWLCVLLHALFDFCGHLVPTLGAGTWWDTPTVVVTVILAVATTVYMILKFARLDLDRVAEIYRW